MQLRGVVFIGEVRGHGLELRDFWRGILVRNMCISMAFESGGTMVVGLMKGSYSLFFKVTSKGGSLKKIWILKLSHEGKKCNDTCQVLP